MSLADLAFAGALRKAYKPTPKQAYKPKPKPVLTKEQQAEKDRLRREENRVLYESEAQYKARIRQAYRNGEAGLKLTTEGLEYFSLLDEPKNLFEKLC